MFRHSILDFFRHSFSSFGFSLVMPSNSSNRVCVGAAAWRSRSSSTHVRLRSRRVELGTLRFLRYVLEENARRAFSNAGCSWRCAWRRSCFCGALRTPLSSGPDQAGKDRLVAILIDRSASMQLKDKGRRLIDLAVDEARQVIVNMATRADRGGVLRSAARPSESTPRRPPMMRRAALPPKSCWGYDRSEKSSRRRTTVRRSPGPRPVC